MNLGAALKLHLRGHYTNCNSPSIEWIPLQEPKWVTYSGAETCISQGQQQPSEKAKVMWQNKRMQIFTPHVVCDEIQH